MTSEPEHPTAGFDDLVHQPNRLGILVVLDEAGRADFTYLKQALQFSDGNLGNHLAVLEQAGLVKTSKEFHGNRPRTWVAITRQGRKRLREELDAMRALLNRFDTNPS